MVNVIVLIISVICALLILVPTLVGLKRGTIKAGVRLGGAVLSAILALITCKLLTSAVQSIAKDMLNGTGTYADVVGGSEGSLITSIGAGATAALIMPFVFVILYWIFNFVIWLISVILMKTAFKKAIQNAKVPNFGWAVGILQGVFTVIMVMAPITGLISMGSSALSIVSNVSPDSEVAAVYTEYAKPLENSIPVKAVNVLGGKALYNNLTTFSVEGHKISVAKELKVIEKCSEDASPLFGIKMAEYSKPQADAVRRLNYNVQKSEFLTLIFTELVPEASESWLEGEKFMGVSSPKLGTELNSFKNTLLEIMATTTDETVKQDISTFFEIAAVIFEHETMKHVDNSNALMNNIAAKGYISQLLSVTYSNKRMSPLVVEITNLGIRTVGSTLSIPADDTVVYKSLMTGISTAVNESADEMSVEKRRQMLFDDLGVCFKRSGVEVSDDEKAVISYHLIDMFGARNDVSSSEMEGFFGAIGEGMVQNGKLSHTGTVEATFTAANDFSDISRQIVDFYAGRANLNIKYRVDGGYLCFDSSNGKLTITHFSEDDKGEVVTSTYQKTVNDVSEFFGVLSSSDEFVSDTKTIADMLLESADGLEGLSAEEVAKEFENLESGIARIVEFIDNSGSNGEKPDTASLESLGDALQQLTENKLLGDTSCDFIEGALRSDYMQSSVGGLDEKAVDNVMTNLRNENGEADKDFSLGNTLASGNEAANLITGLSKEPEDADEPEEEVERSLEWLIENMSESSANVICDMITPDFIREKGLSNGNLEEIAEMLKELFRQMQKSSAMSPEEYKTESAAIKSLYNIMQRAQQQGGDRVFTDDAGDRSAESVLEKFMSSKLVSGTVYSHAFRNGELVVDFLCFGSGSVRSEDKQALIAAIEKYYAAHKNDGDTQLKDKLRAFAAMLCVEISFEGDSVKANCPFTPGMDPFVEEDGKFYYVVDGKNTHGKVQINGKTFLFADTDGAMILGWLSKGSDRYYFSLEEGMYVGIHEIDGVLYQFDKDGRLIKTVG